MKSKKTTWTTYGENGGNSNEAGVEAGEHSDDYQRCDDIADGVVEVEVDSANNMEGDGETEETVKKKNTKQLM